MRVGILAMQGSFLNHSKILKKLGCIVVEIRNSGDLLRIDGLIIPGGETTTIRKLLDEFGLSKDICKLIKTGLPVYGTCAGAILLGKGKYGLGLLDVDIVRNGYGRQIDSFEVDLSVSGIGKFPGVFIRAPVITESNGAKVLARVDDKPVFLVDKNVMVTTFHPELTNDDRIHRYFLDLIKCTM